MSHLQAGCDPLSGFVKAQVGGGKELKKFMLMAALVAVVVAALALPALAQNRLNNNNSSWDNNSRFNDSNNRPWDNWWNNNRFNNDNNNQFNDSNNRFSEDNNNRFNDNNSSWDNNSRFNDNNNGWDNWWNNRPWDNNNRFNDNNSGVSQRNEQQVQSGDSSQTFNVTGGGDNSNSCQGIQGISNTGNAVDNTSVLQYFAFGEVEVGDSGNFEISPSSTTTCNQQVNQAASASG
jgi:hypothetical protein